MSSKIALISATVFFIGYGFACTVGSIFLVSWGSPSVFKTVMNFMLTFPIDWDNLIMRSLFFLVLNISFWTVIVYIIILFIERIINLIRIK